MRLPARRSAISAAADSYAKSAQPRPRTPWREASYCVVDLELTGLNPRRDEIVSFGAVPIEQGRIHLREAVYGLVRPARAVPAESVLVHGLRAADLVDAPPLEEALGALLESMTGRVLVVHAARIERAFLRPALRRHGVRLSGPIVDTSVLGRLWMLERHGTAPQWLSLAALVADLGLPVHRAHNALGDALTTAQAFLALGAHLDALRPETVRSLARAGDRVESMLIYPHRRC
jgi:DNA polymerase-3 subunit epsilon